MSAPDRFVSNSSTPRPAARLDAAGAALLEGLRALLEKAERLVMNYAPRIEALRLGCEAAGLPIPGGAVTGPAPPPAAQAVITYLARTLPGDAGLNQAVRLAVHRFAAVTALAADARAALARGRVTPPDLLETLRRALYFVGHLYEPFRADGVLSRVFPAPTSTTAPPAAPAPRAQRPESVEAAVRRATVLVQRLTVPLGAVKRALAVHDRTAPTTVRLTLEPDARAVRLAGLALASRPEVVADFRDALARHAAVRAALEEATIAPDALIALAAPLEAFASRYRDDAVFHGLIAP